MAAAKTTDKPGAASAASTSTPASSGIKIDQSKLIATVQTLQFGWFIGNILTLLGFSLYSLTYIKFLPKLFKVDYLITLFGVFISFGILNFQLIQKNGFKLPILIKDDNFHYLLLAGFLLFLRPYVWLTLVPFAVFSSFHVLAYTNGYILPIFNLDKSPISKHVTTFINNNNAKSIQIASGIEIITVVWLLIRVITFRKRSLSPFLVYLIFLKKRHEVSPFSRNYFKIISQQGDNLINSIGQPVLKDVWQQVKFIFGKIDEFKLVHDYSKEDIKTQIKDEINKKENQNRINGIAMKLKDEILAKRAIEKKKNDAKKAKEEIAKKKKGKAEAKVKAKLENEAIKKIVIDKLDSIQKKQDEKNAKAKQKEEESKNYRKELKSSLMKSMDKPYKLILRQLQNDIKEGIDEIDKIDKQLLIIESKLPKVDITKTIMKKIKKS
ncbi:unnamed protein product [Candida verbasci]|uniref:Nucleoporin POM33 n=1 Tax=Candida verbasci TaxID=1227364 RepID=A0A9W4X9S1_9ASCO|nr:unnamed protein product [Candida verbasci]